MEISKKFENYDFKITLNKGTSINPGEKDNIDFLINDNSSFNEYVLKLFIDDMDNLPSFIRSLSILFKVIDYSMENKRDFEFSYKVKTNLFILEIKNNDEFREFDKPLIINIPQKEQASTELLEKRLKRVEYENIQLKKQLKPMKQE